MSQEHNYCAFCKSILFDDDDVVYCPECGAPHHRECYKSAGRCANSENHGKQEPESAPAPAREPIDNDEKQPHTDSSVEHDREGHICSNCGRMSTSDTLFCPYCGVPFVEGQRLPFQRTVVFNQMDPYGGVDPKSEIDGVSCADLTLFIRANTRRYIPLFKRFSETGTKRSWNWAAFLFPQSWLFFRKNYFWGFIFALVEFGATLLSQPVLRQITSYIQAQAVPANQQEAISTYIASLGATTPPAWIMWAISLVLVVIVHLVCGMFGDRLYMSRVIEKIKGIRSNEESEDHSAEIFRVGGINPWLALTASYVFTLGLSSVFGVIPFLLLLLAGTR